jgi:hypothetical protein
MQDTSRALLAAGLVVSLAVGCGAETVPSTAGPEPSTAETVPSTAGPELSSAEAKLGAELPAGLLISEEDIYSSVEEMAAGSTAIVSGAVVAVDSLGFPNLLDDPSASEYFLVTVTAETVVKGDVASKEVSFFWEGFVTEAGSGEERVRAGRIVQNGISMPDVGDRLFLFLAPVRPDLSEWLGGKASHQVNTLDGILYVDNGMLVTQLDGFGRPRPAQALNGRPLDEVVQSLPA